MDLPHGHGDPVREQPPAPEPELIAADEVMPLGRCSEVRIVGGIFPDREPPPGIVLPVHADHGRSAVVQSTEASRRPDTVRYFRSARATWRMACQTSGRAIQSSTLLICTQVKPS